MRSKIFYVVALALLLAPSLFPQRAQASGFFLTERGLRTLGRGGAFVAGAEGPESIWINPAGLKGSGASWRMEGNLTILRASFQRVDDAGATRQKVEVETPYLPIPLFAASNDFGLEDWDFAFSVYVPSAQQYKWPSGSKEAPAPQRYSLYTTKGSIFGNFALGINYHGIEGLSIGVAPTLIAGRFATSVALSACDGFVCRHPEDPEFDSASQIKLKSFYSFMIGMGLIYEAGPIKFGASASTPWTIGGEAEINVDLPSHPIFRSATIEGNKADVDIPFPWIARVGLEYNPTEELSLEIAGTWEGWSIQDKIAVTPKSMFIRDVVGIGDYQVGQINIQRLMSNAYSFRFGGEYFMDDLDITLRAGVSYDQTALKDSAISPITLDSDKVVAGIGLTWHLGKVMEVDLVYGHVFLADRTVTTSKITQPAAIRPAPTDASHIANGTYEMEADFFGIGSTTHF